MVAVAWECDDGANVALRHNNRSHSSRFHFIHFVINFVCTILMDTNKLEHAYKMDELLLLVRDKIYHTNTNIYANVFKEEQKNNNNK